MPGTLAPRLPRLQQRLQGYPWALTAFMFKVSLITPRLPPQAVATLLLVCGVQRGTAAQRLQGHVQATMEVATLKHQKLLVMLQYLVPLVVAAQFQ